jgi:DNA polymerase
LHRELTLLKPALIVALGTTAARAIFGRATAIEKNRGRILEPPRHGTAWLGPRTFWSPFIHRSCCECAMAILIDARQVAGFDRFVADLALAKPYASK